MPQLARRLDGEIGEDAVGPRAFECQQAFHHHRVMVEPAVLRGCLEHGVFAAHLISESRHVELVLHPAHDVQIRHARFDHHHVGAFGDVERHFAQGFVGVARVHLIDLFVGLAEVGGRAHGVAERAVERAGVLGAVGHDAGVNMAVGLQRLADRADAAVHHVARGDDVHSGGCLRQRLLHQHGHGGLVHDVAGVVEQTVLAVRGVGVERHIGEHAELWKRRFEGAHRSGHQSVGVGGLDAVGRLEVGIDHGKQREHRNAQFHAFLGHRQQQIDTQTLHAGHRRHALALVLAIEDEHRVDQIVRCQSVLAHQTAAEVVTAQPPHAGAGKSGQVHKVFHLWFVMEWNLMR